MATARMPRFQRPARWLANLLLVGLVIYFSVVLARMTWLIAWQERPVPPVQAQTSAGGAQFTGSTLAAFDLFGEPPRNAPVADVIRRSAPETRLRLRLEGVMVSEQPDLSSAIVAGTDGVTAHYRVGESLPGNVELVEVEPTRILIKRNGQFETLTFEESVSSELITEEPVAQISSADEFVAEARQRLDAEGAQALQPFGLQPVEEGSASGYVYDGSSAMLNAIGLQQGDVITAINGHSLGDLTQDTQLLESWRSQGQLEIEIERGGARFTVSYALPQ
ncbi:MAG: type II secretion system protein GspC [Marinobacter sp.]|uniref:type II secretion system protein GspC n=1 Tax=Marinobacter sp. TaxID=50741 RepID=UPI00299F1CE9|nr:type II secretion system protein GspC [Marinobacter sp.]MDX1633635.1 type II secretion system protein GspC [Marinobacter sp.]